MSNFFPTQIMRPNPMCESMECRAQQAKWSKLEWSPQQWEAACHDETPAEHSENTWGIVCESSPAESDGGGGSSAPPAMPDAASPHTLTSSSLNPGDGLKFAFEARQERDADAEVVEDVDEDVDALAAQLAALM